jgi:GntR family transcriptional regulator/MocR family aminotransferase
MGEQLICALRDAIEQGTLPPGTRLPSTRDLALDLRVSRGLVVGVYERLTAEGRLTAKRGSGTVVSRVSIGSRDPRERQPSKAAGGADVAPAGIGRASLAGPGTFDRAAPNGHRALGRQTQPSGVLALRPGVPDLGLFPRAAWRRAYERAVALAADADFDYGDPAGAFRLRAELAAYLGRIRAARVDVERLVVTSGSTQAFALIGQVLRAAHSRAGRVCRIAVEDPGSPAISACLAAQGLRPVPVPVDADGIDVGALAVSGVDAVLVTPAHQYPTGAVLAPRRRTAILEWARRTDALIIEDDFDAELRYDREPIGCLQGLAPEQVMLVGSASRTLAPALRMGWLVSPRGWWAELCDAKRLADGGGPALEQLAFAELLAGVAYDRHLRRARRALRERRETLVAQVRRHLPNAAVTGASGGLHLTIALPRGFDDATLAARARSEGLGLLALSELRFNAEGTRARGASDPQGASGLVLGFAGSSPSELASAVRTIQQLLS